MVPKDFQIEAGERLKALRNNMHLTQEELSDLSHVSVKHIANIEKGRKNPSLSILVALRNVLHFSVDQLIDPNVTEEDLGAEKMKQLYLSCPPEARENLVRAAHSIYEEMRNLIDSKK